MKYLISGGGTGGHIFPAVSIANALRELDPEAEILFIGALGRMEMERVPQAGYQIIGLPVRGFNRSQPWKNFSVLLDLLRSIRQVRKIIRDFQPNAGVGVGGYASGAAMWAAAKMGIPILLQEQNGFAGVTNKLLKNKATKICVAYPKMERFFPAEKIILTGNPVRQNLTSGSRQAAYTYFQQEFGVTFDTNKKNLLIIGGSLGARTINQAILAGLETLHNAGIQVVWQTGKVYYDKILSTLHQSASSPHVQSSVVTPFLCNMPDAYAWADLVISRAGASSISELCLLGKPSVLVPSPNVAEDHQTHNAMALVNQEAALLVRDIEAENQLINTAIALINDTQRLEKLHTNTLAMAQTNSATRIAQEVIKLAQKTKKI